MASRPPKYLRVDFAVIQLGVQGVLLIAVGLTLLVWPEAFLPRGVMIVLGLLFLVLGARDLKRAATDRLTAADRE